MRPVALSIGVMLALSACPAGDPESTATVSPPPGARRGGILRVALAADVDSLDPHVASSPPSWFFARALHRGLLAFPPEGNEPVPDLATSMPRVDPSGTRYTFRLRDGIRFTRGDLRSSDAAASLARVVRAGRGVARFLDVIRGARAVAAGRARRLSGITTPDERTVVITLTRRADDLPWILAHPQIAILPASTRAAGDVAPTGIDGLGPYRLAVHEPEQRISLARNPLWRQDPVRGAWLDGIESTLGVHDPEAAVVRGEAELVVDPGPPDRAQPPLPDTPNVYRTEPSCVRYLFLNTRVAPFTRRAARLAVARAVRREPLRSNDPAATSLLPPSVLGHRDTLAVPQSDARARAFSTRLVVARSPRDRAEARAIRAALARAGIRVRVQTVDPALLHPSYADPAARVPMGIASWCADWPGLAGRNVLGSIADPRAVRERAPNPIYAGPRSRALVRALEAAERAPAARAARVWAEATAIAERTAALVPLTYPVPTVVAAHTLGGYRPAAMWPRGDPTALWLGARMEELQTGAPDDAAG